MRNGGTISKTGLSFFSRAFQHVKSAKIQHRIKRNDRHGKNRQFRDFTMFSRIMNQMNEEPAKRCQETRALWFHKFLSSFLFEFIPHRTKFPASRSEHRKKLNHTHTQINFAAGDLTGRTRRTWCRESEISRIPVTVGTKQSFFLAKLKINPFPMVRFSCLVPRRFLSVDF